MYGSTGKTGRIAVTVYGELSLVELFMASQVNVGASADP